MAVLRCAHLLCRIVGFLPEHLKQPVCAHPSVCVNVHYLLLELMCNVDSHAEARLRVKMR